MMAVLKPLSRASLKIVSSLRKLPPKCASRSPRTASCWMNGVGLLAALGTAKPANRVLLNTPVSPRWWPVAIAEELAIVKVGNTAWLLTRDTPWRARAARFGAVSWLTARERSPSATKITTLCGTAAGEGRPDPARQGAGGRHPARPTREKGRKSTRKPPRGHQRRRQSQNN